MFQFAGPAAILFVAVLSALAIFQVALIAGTPLGHFAWGGQHRILPRNLRVGSLVSIGIYAILALVVLDRTGLIALLPAGLSAVAIWVVAAYMALGVVVNAMSRSRPESLLMTPVALILGLAALIVALN